MAAREHLIITFEGRDQHLNQRRPPAVPVAELLDVVDKTVRVAPPRQAARDVVVVQHPLQGFDPANFTPGKLSVPAPWRFDEVYLEGARAMTGKRRPGHEFLPERLPPLAGAQIQLSSLVRFLEHPVKAFLRERLGYYAADVPEQLSDALPVEMGPLDRWELGDRMLEARLGGADLGTTLLAEQGRGLLPPGALGEGALAEVRAVVEALVAEVGSLPCGDAPVTSVEVNVALADGRSLVGTVPGVRENVVLRCTYSKLAAKHRLRAWAYFLALSASRPELAPSAITIGQAEGSTGAKPRLSTSTLGPLAGDPEVRRSAAVAALEILVDLYQRGMREPLPIYCATSAAWVAERNRDESPIGAARTRWGSRTDDFPGESAEPEHLTVLGSAVPLEQVLERLPDDDEDGPGWDSREKSRFERLAARLWRPVLEHELLRER